MLWFILSILTALFRSLTDVFSKWSLSDVDEYVVSWCTIFLALPLLLPMAYYAGIPELKPEFYPVLIVTAILEALVTILYVKSIKLGDLSLSIPMITLTPVFLLITSPIIVGEFPSLKGIAGMLLIVAGCYIINIDRKNRSIIEPFKALAREKGPRYMMFVAFFWGITSNLDKVGIQSSSSIFYLACLYTLMSIILFPFMVVKNRKWHISVRKTFLKLLPVGLFTGLYMLLQMKALTMTLVAYVISIKRTSAAISVFFGHLLFDEKGFKERVGGVFLMLLGVTLIAFSK